jgi:hypothetical protein
MKASVSKKINYIFIIESNNDLDMTAPLTWKFSKDRHANVFIINTLPGLLSIKDPRIAYINKSSNVKYIEISKNFKILDDISSYIYSIFKIGYFHRKYLIKQLGYSQKDFEKIPITKNEPTLVFVSYFLDHTAVKSAILWANKYKFFKIFNNHGITPFTVKKNLESNLQSPFFDICILNKNSEKNLPKLNNKNTKMIYASPRFSEEWSKELTKIFPKKIKKKKKFRLVFMLSKWLGKDDRGKILSAIKAVSKIKDSEIIIKPHTRGMVIKDLFPSNVIIANEELNSRKIIQETDVVIFTRSSIFLDAVLLYKPVIHLSYATKVELASDTLRSCRATCQKNLIEKIYKIMHTGKIYTLQNRKKCISFYAGKDNGKMLDNVTKSIKLSLKNL